MASNKTPSGVWTGLSNFIVCIIIFYVKLNVYASSFAVKDKEVSVFNDIYNSFDDAIKL